MFSGVVAEVRQGSTLEVPGQQGPVPPSAVLVITIPIQAKYLDGRLANAYIVGQVDQEERAKMEGTGGIGEGGPVGVS